MTDTTHFVCLPCRVYQRDNDVCCQCDRHMEHGTLCRCGDAIAAKGADECIECIADEVRADAGVLDGIFEPLRSEVLAHMRKPATPTYSVGALFRRQA